MTISNRREFLKRSSLVAVTVAVPAWVLGCGSKSPSPKGPGGGDMSGGDMAAAEPNSEWEARASELESNTVLTTAEPGDWDGKAGSHVPQVSFEDGAAVIFTGHPMTEEHWITVHYIKNQDGMVIGLQEYAGTDAEAKTSFELPEGTTEITAYSHCNKHDHWSADPAAVG